MTALMHAIPLVTFPAALAGAFYWYTQEERRQCLLYLACALVSGGTIIGLLIRG